MADFLLDQLFIYNKTNIAVISREYRFYFQATLYFRFTLLRYFWATNTNPDISVGIVVFPQVLPDYCILQYFNEYFPNIYCDISAVFLSGNNISVKNINVFTLKWLLQLTQTISSVYEDYMICNKGIKHCHQLSAWCPGWVGNDVTSWFTMGWEKLSNGYFNYD